MTATVLTTARPAGCAIAWATKDAIFVEIPCRAGPPYIVRYRKTLDGLTAALNILIEHEEPAHRPVPAAHPIAKRAPTGASARAAWATDAQREKAREILRKLKIT